MVIPPPPVQAFWSSPPQRPRSGGDCLDHSYDNHHLFHCLMKSSSWWLKVVFKNWKTGSPNQRKLQNNTINCDRHSGTVALWHCGTLALWHCGTLALWPWKGQLVRIHILQVPSFTTKTTSLLRPKWVSLLSGLSSEVTEVSTVFERTKSLINKAV